MAILAAFQTVVDKCLITDQQLDLGVLYIRIALTQP